MNKCTLPHLAGERSCTWHTVFSFQDAWTVVVGNDSPMDPECFSCDAKPAMSIQSRCRRRRKASWYSFYVH